MPGEKTETIDISGKAQTGSPGTSGRLDVVRDISPLHIARFFLEKSASLSEKGLTNLYLNKIAYIAHGFHWGNFKRPLITNDELPEVWKLGPVYNSIYDCFEFYGRRAMRHDYFDKYFMKGDYELDFLEEPEHEDSKALLEAVWEKRKDLSAWDLVKEVHEKGSPWYTIWRKEGGRYNRGMPIPDGLTARFYIDLVDQLRESNNA